MEIKPGILTSENAYTLVINIFAILVLTGHVSADESEVLVDLGVKIVSGLFALITTVAYISGRVGLKKEAMKLRATLELAGAVDSLDALSALDAEEEPVSEEVVEEPSEDIVG